MQAKFPPEHFVLLQQCAMDSVRVPCLAGVKNPDSHRQRTRATAKTCRLTAWRPDASRYRQAYIIRGSFITRAGISFMEAEQLNTIENRLADLGLRATELRRYL
jgi:hypothetical protein